MTKTKKIHSKCSLLSNTFLHNLCTFLALFAARCMGVCVDNKKQQGVFYIALNHQEGDVCPVIRKKIRDRSYNSRSIIGKLNEEVDASVDFSEMRSHPLKPIIH